MSLRDDLIEAIATTGGIDERWATRVLDAMLDKLEEHGEEWPFVGSMIDEARGKS